jgi:hypothetical protein
MAQNQSWAWLVAVGALSTGLVGCGGSVGAACDKYCECVGCTDAEFDECLDDGEVARDRAADVGCVAEGDDYLYCLADVEGCNDNSECDGQGVTYLRCVQEYCEANPSDPNCSLF